MGFGGGPLGWLRWPKKEKHSKLEMGGSEKCALCIIYFITAFSSVDAFSCLVSSLLSSIFLYGKHV